MRVLYVDANVWHINPTANLLPVLIRERFPTSRCFGPGFSSPDELALGLLGYVDAKGPFDVVLLGPGTPFLVEGAAADDGAVNYLRRYSAHRIGDQVLRKFFGDVRHTFGRLEVPVKLVSVLNFDYYATTQRQIDVLLEQSIGVLGPNEQFVLRLEDLPDFAAREKHYVRKADRFSNAWRDFLIRYPERVLTATHFVGGQEFFFEPLADRPYEIAVPGVEYLLRRDAVNKLARTRLRSASKTYFHLYRVANRLGLPAFSNATALRLYNFLFQRTLAETRCVYTARGGFGMPIRKFFEIPAAGALLLCSPCTGYADLGFAPDRHYIQAEPEQLVSALATWLNDPRAPEVARAGQDLVIAKHSISARGEQIDRCLQAMLGGTYRGARWNHGEYVLTGEVPLCAD